MRLFHKKSRYNVSMISRGIFYIRIALMRICYYMVKWWHPNVAFTGKCCCKNLKITTVNDSTGNKIIFGKHVVLKNCGIRFEGGNHTLHFGDGIRLENVDFFFEKQKGTISIGDGTWIGAQSELSAFDNSSIVIGDGCIFAKQIMLRTSDSHVIKDSAGNIINMPKDIVIGSHVWLGQQVFVLKGAVIPDGCIVGARSTVTASLKADVRSLIIGQPAKTIKKEISWEL